MVEGSPRNQAVMPRSIVAGRSCRLRGSSTCRLHPLLQAGAAAGEASAHAACMCCCSQDLPPAWYQCSPIASIVACRTSRWRGVSAWRLHPLSLAGLAAGELSAHGACSQCCLQDLPLARCQCMALASIVACRCVASFGSASASGLECPGEPASQLPESWPAGGKLRHTFCHPVRGCGGRACPEQHPFDVSILELERLDGYTLPLVGLQPPGVAACGAEATSRCHAGLADVLSINLLVPDLAMQVEQSTTGLGEQSEPMAKRLQVQADAEGSFADTTSTKEADDKFIDMLVQDLAVQVEQATTDLGEKS